MIYILSNQVDLALCYFPICLSGYAHSPTFKILGKLHDEALYTFICRKDSGIKTIEEFHGKSLGVFGDCLSKAAMDSLAKKGIHFGLLKTVHFDLTTILYTKALDIISGTYWNIEPFQLQNKGVEIKSFKWADFDFPDYPELVFISNQTFLNKNTTFAKRFRKAIHESISYCLKEPEKAFELYLKQHPEKTKEATWEKQAWDATYPVLARSQDFDIPRLIKFYQWLDDCKILCREFKVEEILESNT